MDWLKLIIVAVIAYFLGNFSTGVVVGKAIAHIDIREHGSGNAGTTNILRTLGWLPSVLTFLGDACKAVIAALIGLWIFGKTGARVGGVFAVIGHNWPVFYGFKGGKGMAASFGAILVIDPLIALILMVCQIVVLAATRYMSVASIVSSVAYSLLVLFIRPGDGEAFVFALVLTLLALYSHRSNMVRLAHRSENRLDFQKINKLSKDRMSRKG